MEDHLKRLKINFAASKTSSPNSVVQKSFKSFHRNDELVGLGIVAAMSTYSSATDHHHHHHHLETNTTPSSKINHQIRAAKVLSVAVTKPMIEGTKSIPIQSSSGAGTVVGLGFELGGERVACGGFDDEMVISDSYAGVVSQIGNDRVSKREYFDDRGSMRKTGVVSRGVFSTSFAEVVDIEEKPFWEDVDFLSSCFLCRKDLSGIDIFMYRGEKAFCSVECRDVQIATDKLKEKRGRVRVRSMEHSESPCCSPLLTYTSVAAA